MTSDVVKMTVKQALDQFSAILEDYEYRSCYEQIEMSRDTLAATIKAQAEEIERLRAERDALLGERKEVGRG